MFRNRILKILALLMVLNILIIPLTSFTPQQQNKYKVYAAEGIVDIRFFNAVVSMIGITAAGLATMSPSFTIPEADLVEMKNNFAQSLEADAVKKQAWLAAQTDYLAGGIAKTMGAVELAKIGINDIYTNLKSYINSNLTKMPEKDIITTNTIINDHFKMVVQMHHIIGYFAFKTGSYTSYYKAGELHQLYKDSTSYPWTTFYTVNFYQLNSDKLAAQIKLKSEGKQNILEFGIFDSSNSYINQQIYNEVLQLGYPISGLYPSINFKYDGFVNQNTNNDIINSTDATRSIIPTIPWIDTTVPVGTIVTPAISAPYAGTVPIDVPITAPIDPPIDEPVDPPVEDNIAGTIAAILAGLTPIAGFLEYILAGQVTLTDAIESGITGVIDGIGDIAGTLTDGITTSLTDIQTSIGSLLDPPTETLDLDKLKNLNSVLFTKFPFSIPFDFIAIVTALNADPVAPVLSIPFNMQDFGGSNSNVEIDLSIYDNFANIARQIGFIGFVIFMLFNTRKLIWK